MTSFASSILSVYTIFIFYCYFSEVERIHWHHVGKFPKTSSLEDEKPSSTPTLDEGLPPRADAHEHAKAEKGLFGLPKHKKHQDLAGVDFSMVDEKTVLRKMDIRLIPILAVLYLLSFLDRGTSSLPRGQICEIHAE